MNHHQNEAKAYLKDRDRSDYLQYIITKLEMDLGTFIINVVRELPYETLVYAWIDRFYENKIPKEEALSRIITKRNQNIHREFKKK